VDYSIWLIIGGASAVAFYMAWSIGSNDVANSMATAVGAKAITFKQAVVIAGILNFIGAVFVGSHVSDTVRKGIITTTGLSNHLLLLGFVASLLAAAIWVTLSTWKSMPISTTHSIIGALMGFGIIAGGLSAVQWGQVLRVTSSWILSPIAGCILAFFIFKIIVKAIFAKDHPVKSAKIVGPIIFGFTAFLIVSSLFLKTSISKSYDISEIESLGIAFISSIVVAVIGIFLLRKVKERGPEDYSTVERIFRKLQVGTSCYVAFAHGANDVANAIGPVAAIIPLANGLSIGSQVMVPTWLLALGGVGIAFGCLTWGRRVMQTVGKKIGAVIGVGLARGLEAVDLSVIKKIVLSWAVTLPVASMTSIGIYLLLKLIIGG